MAKDSVEEMSKDEQAELLFKWRKMLLEVFVAAVAPDDAAVKECATFMLRDKKRLTGILSLVSSLIAMDSTAETTFLKQLPGGKELLRPLVEKALRMARADTEGGKMQEGAKEWVKLPT